MGGGIAILTGAKYKNISKLITLNSMSNFYDLLKRFNANEWQKTGKVYVENTRTNQQMPLHYQLLQDYMLHKQDLDIATQAALIQSPWLLVYATNDETVVPQHAFALQAINTQIKLCPIENTGHTFGATHPLDLNNTNSLAEVVEKMIDFLKE
jgi:uncharacterized protein